tara:strand:- start:521 stop:2302 length:1782 start_codon:yes stop_codon:yes gene_type:complete
MTYAHPSAHSATYASNPAGRADNVRSAVGSKISTPVFVDNAVHHARYERNKDSQGRQLKVIAPSQSDFQMTHPRRYRAIEEESTLRLTHADKQGVRDNDAIYFDGALMGTGSTPPLLAFGADVESSFRLRASNVETASKGTRLHLFNMKGRSLTDLGADAEENHYRLGQTVNVGLRTTDLIQYLLKDKMQGFNSVSTGLPYTGTRLGDTQTYQGAVANHSMHFLSENFYGVSVVTAMRYTARHDGHVLFYDRFGNLIYAPEIFHVIDRQVGKSKGSGGSENDPIVDIANRIVVQGKQHAVNDDLMVSVDDAELQKKHGNVKQQKIIDPTATNTTSARRSANQLLRLNRKAQGAIKSKAHASSWDIEPGDVVLYDNPVDRTVERLAVVEVEHELSSQESDFQFVSYERGIEGAILALTAEGELLAEPSAGDTATQIVKKDISSIGGTVFRSRGYVQHREVTGSQNRVKSTYTHHAVLNKDTNIHSGFIIGHRGATSGDNPARSAIGVGLTQKTAHTGLVGTTLTVTSTAGFPPTGHLIIEGTKHISYTGIGGATTFTGVTAHVGTVGGSGTVQLIRPRAHEIGTVKGRRRRGTF